jgi:mono/diheme cytochrome c family protein
MVKVIALTSLVGLSLTMASRAVELTGHEGHNVDPHAGYDMGGSVHENGPMAVQSPQQPGNNRRKPMKKQGMFLITAFLLTACSDPGASSARDATRNTDPAVLARGAQLFQKNCASCHGDRAQGAFAWQRPGVDGKYPPPPLDGSAHAWHHPYAALKQTIRQGTLHIGGNMPAWGGTLSESDIEAVIAWFQSLWPDPIFSAWADTDRRARTGGGAR